MNDQLIAEAALYATNKQTNICALSKIQNHNPNNLVAADLHLRLNSHQDWPRKSYMSLKETKLNIN